MKKLIGFIFIASIVSIFWTLAVFKYAPLSWLETQAKHALGSTITTILSTDRLSDSRAVINTNFSNLNTDKAETTATTLSSLSSIGTITTGVWNGTAIGVLYGGTGTTSPTLNQIMFGNAGSGFKVIGFGSSGQFLTSSGNGTTPTWTTSALDTTLSYNWTGSYFGVKNLYASSTVANPLVLNTVSYNTPASNTGIASSSIWQIDTSGGFTFGSPQFSYLNFPADANGSSTTLAYFTLPANSLSTNGYIEVMVSYTNFAHQSSNSSFFEIAYGNSTTTINLPFTAGTAAKDGTVRVILGGNGATNSQKMSFGILGMFQGNRTTTETLAYFTTGSYAVDSTANKAFMIVVKPQGGVHFQADAVTVSLHRN